MRSGLWPLLCLLTAAHPGCGHRGPAGADGPRRTQPPFWEVFPELSHDGHTLTPQDALQTLPDSLQLRLEIDGSDAHIDLLRNRQLLPDFHAVTYYVPDGSAAREQRQLVNCYYHGTAAGSGGPWSSLSLCAGLRGTIILAAEQQFSIEPVPGDASYKHIMRRIGKQQKTACEVHSENGSVSERWRRALLSFSEEGPQQVKRDVETEVKYVELVMVADNSEFTAFHRDLGVLHGRMAEIANSMDAFYRPLGIRVVLVMVEFWTQKDLISVSEDPAETLDRFLLWREKNLIGRVPHDNAQLLTGVRFKGSSVGMATVSSMCTTDRSGGVTSDHSVSVLFVASTMAHELGHNLGMNHDTGDGACGQPTIGKQWIMTQSTGFMPGLEFSNCSLKDLITSLHQGGGICLFNVPSPGSVYGKPMCGNLLVEEGEQCDCGLLQDCTDPCCNASSCQLMPGAQCSSDGLCCEQCKISPPGSLCRQRLGECDLSEYCSGESAHCPANVYLQDGAPCANGHAHCYQGECRTLQKQCQDLWGLGSSPAPDSCFAKVNMRADKYGNCGRAADGTYRPCTLRNVLCGSIQCLGGRDRPLLGASAEIISVKVSVNGSQISCRGTYFNLGDDVWDSVLVKTGTVCGPGKVCISQQCRNAAELKVQACTCGGHGVCNSNGNCHCDAGWAPPHCGSSGPGGSVDSGPLAGDQAGGSVAGTVFLVLLVIGLLLILLFCYLKRQFLHRKLISVFSKSSKCQYRVTESSHQPRPQRPPPPQWTQSTELQVMSATNQSEGYDRPEPPSKPLPPDPVQKRLQAAAQDRPPAPTRPLPEDPLPRRAQVSSFAEPPPPAKPLSWSPTQQCHDLLLGSPADPQRVSAMPARPAPQPPYTRRSPNV